MAVPTGSKLFRPFPSKPADGLGGVPEMDKEFIKAQYLSGEHYGWNDFCAEHNYSPGISGKQQLNFIGWQALWLEAQSQSYQDKVIPKAMSVRDFVANTRLEYPQKWNDEAMNMMNIGRFLVRRMSVQAKYDMDNEQEILEGKKKSAITWKPHDYATVVRSMAQLQSIHRYALLMPMSQQEQSVIPLPERDAESINDQAEFERLQNLGTGIRGGGVLDGDKITLMAAQFYDNMPKRLSTEPQAPEEGMDEPLDSLE
jgi:hypothetical protein